MGQNTRSEQHTFTGDDRSVTYDDPDLLVSFLQFKHLIVVNADVASTYTVDLLVIDKIIINMGLLTCSMAEGTGDLVLKSSAIVCNRKRVSCCIILLREPCRESSSRRPRREAAFLSAGRPEIGQSRAKPTGWMIGEALEQVRRMARRALRFLQHIGQEPKLTKQALFAKAIGCRMLKREVSY